MKTTASSQPWQPDASYYFVVGWSWYYSIEVLHDFSRFVLASDLKSEMTAHSISDVVERAVAFTGVRQTPSEDRSSQAANVPSSKLRDGVPCSPWMNSIMGPPGSPAGIP